MTVFISCPGDRVDETSIRREYGEPCYVSSRFLYPDELEDDRIPPFFLARIESVSILFNPRQDYVLIGADYLQLVALVEAIVRHHGALRLLRWDNKAQGHVPVWVGTLRRVHNLTAPQPAC